MDVSGSAARATGMLWLLALAGCATPLPLPNAVHWYRNAAEMRASYEQTYVLAARELRTMAQGRPRNSWGVIMDVDETLLDNSAYVKEFGHYTESTWDIWTARQSATALPGAAHFTATVRELGGVVALVTNREQKACADTATNLQRAGIGYDRILCMTDTGDKNPRFAAIQSGGSGDPPLDVLMWLGDNIGDFPGLSQNSPDLSAFGVRYFVFPNPVYGSWEDLPRN